MTSRPSRDLGLPADLQNEIDKADRTRVDLWLETLERESSVVLRTSALRIFLYALAAWVFVVLIVGVFIATPTSSWNPFSAEHRGFTGWIVAAMGLLFLLALLLFGVGVLLCTFVYPIARPRLVVSWWGIRSVWSMPGGEREIFSAPWPDVVAVGGRFASTRWPFPYTLHVTITVRADAAHGSSRRRRVRREGGNAVYDVDGMLRGRRRDVLAFLSQVRAAVQGTARR